jgi:hypothetical protein
MASARRSKSLSSRFLLERRKFTVRKKYQSERKGRRRKTKPQVSRTCRQGRGLDFQQAFC